MWTTYVKEARLHNGVSPHDGGHIRQDSAMDAHFAAVALAGLKLGNKAGCVSADDEGVPSLRNQNWLDPQPRQEDKMGGRELHRANSQAIEAFRAPARISAPSQQPEIRVEGNLYQGIFEQIPVHLADLRWAGKEPTLPGYQGPVTEWNASAEKEGYAETSPERIRHPRDKPRRKDIKPSTRRNLNSAFKAVSTQSYGGKAHGNTVPLTCEVLPRDVSRTRSLFDWSTFSNAGVQPESTKQSSARTTASEEEASGSLSDSDWTSSTSSSADVTLGSVHPNDSCIDFHEDLSVQDRMALRLESLRASETARTLSSALETRGTALSSSEIAAVIRGVVPVLEILHSHDIVHRHVTPDMIIVDDFNDIKSASLQPSPIAVPLGNSTRFLDALVVGDPAFASPEISRSCRGCVPYSPASDMWSLGVTILAMVMPNQAGPFGSSGMLPSGNCQSPPVNAPMDELQTWLEHQLWVYMNCTTEPSSSKEPVPLDMQALVLMLMRADPGQRANAAYLHKINIWADATQPPEHRDFSRRSSHAPKIASQSPVTPTGSGSSIASIESSGTPTSVLRIRTSVSRGNSVSDGEIEGIQMPPPARSRYTQSARRDNVMCSSNCECPNDNGLWGQPNRKRIGDSRRSSSASVVWDSIVTFFCGK